MKSRQECTQITATSSVSSQTEPETYFPTHKKEEVKMDTSKSRQYPRSFQVFIQGKKKAKQPLPQTLTAESQGKLDIDVGICLTRSSVPYLFLATRHQQITLTSKTQKINSKLHWAGATGPTEKGLFLLLPTKPCRVTKGKTRILCM